ncbi:hypothetical protein [Pseudomonas sp. CES]|uniref:hypothetical protein n=1 Tax=Pseudomonas sp. CES TaxID=2719586 RepID=UPI00147039CB|nr:hypothetical protein [Pseudomonas sp. CES]KAF4560181.1 hypothetical protein HBJ16_002259 [Pseudomonas sp. CES]
MNMYFSGVSSEHFCTWQKSIKVDNAKAIFLSPNDFFERLQKEGRLSKSKFTWMYLPPWLEASGTAIDAVVSSLKVWLTRQHSARLCLLSSNASLLLVNIASESFNDFWIRSHTTSTNKKLVVHEDDSLMLGMMKSLAPTFYNTYNALESNSLQKISEGDDNKTQTENIILSKFIAFSNCYKKQLAFDHIQNDLEFKVAELEKHLILERDARLKAEAGQRRLKEEYNSLNSTYISENALLNSRIRYAENQLLEYSHVARLYSDVLDEAQQALQLATKNDIRKVAYGQG